MLFEIESPTRSELARVLRCCDEVWIFVAPDPDLEGDAVEVSPSATMPLAEGRWLDVILYDTESEEGTDAPIDSTDRKGGKAALECALGMLGGRPVELVRYVGRRSYEDPDPETGKVPPAGVRIGR